MTNNNIKYQRHTILYTTNTRTYLMHISTIFVFKQIWKSIYYYFNRQTEPDIENGC